MSTYQLLLVRRSLLVGILLGCVVSYAAHQVNISQRSALVKTLSCPPPGEHRTPIINSVTRKNSRG